MYTHRNTVHTAIPSDLRQDIFKATPKGTIDFFFIIWGFYISVLHPLKH